MTFERESMPKEEYDDMLEAWGDDFHNNHITEDEYAKRLAKAGLNATEIKEQIAKYEPKLGF